MSKATKRKHVTREVLEDFIEPGPEQKIAKVLGGKGNNFHDVLTSDGEQFVASMPTKFRRNVWIKRGDYVVLDPIVEGIKVKGEIVAILYPEQIEYLKEKKLWPEAFTERKESSSKDVLNSRSSPTHSDSEDGSSEASLNLELGPNPNRPPAIAVSGSEDSESEKEC
jgi:probable RNA-binding protein EIF1AD